MRFYILVLLVSVLVFSCSRKEQKSQFIFNEGVIFGTMYHITYESPGGKDFAAEIMAELSKVDTIFSSYIPESQISKINRNEPVVLDTLFYTVFNSANQISEQSGGAFDVTVAPLVNAWGFGFKKKENVTQAMIDSILPLIGYKKVKLVDGKIMKEDPRITLDLSSLAEGFGVDVVGRFLTEKKCKNFMVEIGGEVLAHGVNKQGKQWRIGINKPNDNEPSDATSLQAIVEIKNEAISTSGNYRKFYIENGKKFAHTIDPFTGYPVEHNLLSATVITDDCMTADAWSTAFMVLGTEKSKEIAKALDIDIFLVSSVDSVTNEIYMNEGFKKRILEN